MMKPPMGPPPPRNPNPRPDPNPDPKSSTGADQAAIEEAAPVIPPDGDPADGSAALVAAKPEKEAPEDPDPNASSTPSGSKQRTAPSFPYSIPPWSEPPGHPFFFEVLKDGAIIDKLDVSEKGAYMFGRIDLCDFMLEHPTISRFHAVLQFKKDAEASLFDLGSTHGTFINKIQVKQKVYTKVHVGDVIRFGQSSRLYIFQGPSEFMPPEGDLKKLRDAKLIREEMIDREASLSRARDEASLADGISWGMGEDAIVDTTENDADEITWQTYKGQLTERKEKTRGKVIKRMEKVANMKKEIDAIRAKDITQGGLTQGQQTQIARNEQRISQILEELESLEETLNESIQESIGARAGKLVHGRKKGNVEEDDFLSSFQISYLTSCFLELKNLRSCNLLQDNWISFAWYPLYRIQVGPTLKDFDACFLTIHSLSTPMKDESLSNLISAEEVSARDSDSVSHDISMSNSVDPTIDVEKMKKEMKVMEAALQGAAREAQKMLNQLLRLPLKDNMQRLLKRLIFLGG